MTYIITKHPHALDEVWGQAIEAMSNANDAMDALGSDYTDEQINAVGERRTSAIMTILALPARNVADSLYKRDLAAADGGAIRTDCDAGKIRNEANDVLSEALDRGQQESER